MGNTPGGVACVRKGAQAQRTAADESSKSLHG